MAATKGLVHFIHGKESGPWGLKIQRLAKIADVQNYEVASLDYADLADADKRVERLLDANPVSENLILVGSSMGGYVATIASQQLVPKGLFLMAPAFSLPGYYEESYPTPKAEKITIVHGWRDDIIAPSSSFRFAELYRAQLHLINGDHRLHDAIEVIEALFKLFLDDIAHL